MSNGFILPLLLFFPFLGSLLLLVADKLFKLKSIIYYLALAISAAIFGYTLWIANYLSSSNYVANFDILYSFGAGLDFSLGVNGISLLLILFVSLVFPFLILSSLNKQHIYGTFYLICLFGLEMVLFGAFLAKNLLLFYLFFEASLIPMFFLISIWGNENRFYASFRFFIYTLFGSVFMLVGLMVLYQTLGSLNIAVVTAKALPASMQYWVFWLFFIAFAIKLPIFPVHHWLLDTQTSASKEATMIIAGLLFLLGGYGLLFICLPIFPKAIELFFPFLCCLAVVGIFYNFIIALVQQNAKKLMAYSLVAHMCYLLLGLFSGSQQGVQGAIFQMLAHGFIALAIFYMIGILFERANSDNINSFNNVANDMPRFSTVLMILIMANIGLPGTAGFIGEFLILLGIYQYSFILSVFATMGVFLSASYALWFYRGLVFKNSSEETHGLLDLSINERVIAYSFAGIILFFGFYPKPLLNMISPEVSKIVSKNYGEIVSNEVTSDNDNNGENLTNKLNTQLSESE